MSTPLPAVLNEDTIPVLLARLGTPFRGDGQMNFMVGEPARVGDVLMETTITTAHTNAGFSAGDATKVVAILHTKKASK